VLITAERESRLKLRTNTASLSKAMALVCKAAVDRLERSDQPDRKASVSGNGSDLRLSCLLS